MTSIGDRVASFRGAFGRDPEVLGEAHGRVNLIGEHTDYNGGFVLPTLIPQRTRAELARRGDRRATVVSANLGKRESWELGEEKRLERWVDYVQGITRAVREAGLTLGGFDLLLSSDVPLGAGLSSSAALEVAVLRALREAFGLDLDDAGIARLAHRAETEHVGAPVGLMDQYVCSLGRLGEALFMDMRTLSTEGVAIPPKLALIVIDSGVRHSNVAGDYRQRRTECQEAARLLGVVELRDARLEDVESARLPELLGRRARHVVTENERVLATVEALRRDDLAAVAEAFRESHRSMRDDFEVSVPQIDLLVALADSHAGTHGARLTGGGFGGSIVALADSGSARMIAEKVAIQYEARACRSARILLPLREEP